MNLIIYACVREEDRTISLEQSVIAAWSDTAPALTDRVSMGADARWEAIEITPYFSSDSVVEQVYFVQVHRIDLPLPHPDQWTVQDASPDETIHIELSAVGAPELQLGFNVLGKPPKLGERLIEYKPTSHPTLMQSVATAWTIEDYDQFLPKGVAFYKAVYLSWCRTAAPV